MNLQILDLESLSLLKDKACLKSCLNKYKNYPQNKWLHDVCGKNPFIDTKYLNLPDIVFDMSAKNPSDTDFENVKAVYETLKFLSDSNASEERLWAALCLGIGYTYVQYRWPSQTIDNVRQHYFFGFGNRRSYSRNAIARLWWIGRLTYDKDRANPYELTRFVCEHSDHIMHLIDRNTSNNLHILRPFIEAVIEAREQGYDINTDDVGELSKYLNLLGGAYILDFMPEEWIKEKITTKIESMVTLEGLEPDMEEATDDKEKTVGNSNSIVLQDMQSRKKIMISAKKNKFRTIPASLVGLKHGDTVKIGKILYRIIGIK